jgi:hypothetical protein
MTAVQVLALWLDGFDMAIADRFALPALGRLQREGATVVLDNGGDELTGLSGEHLATGLDPRAARRASAVWFDPATYRCEQRGVSHPPAFGAVPAVVFDPCYFDLDAADPSVQGLTDWGAHDPGGPGAARPVSLRAEVRDRFGPYPAKSWIYATPWASVEDCTRAGADLAEAVRTRTRIASWLLGARLPDRPLALVGVSEAHSATEALHHGIDPSPRWHDTPSRLAAGAALRGVYTAIDELVGTLVEEHPDAVHVVFSLHGMGPNTSDVPTMVLLGELLRRWAGDPTPDLAFPLDVGGLPRLSPGASWSGAVFAALGEGRRRVPDVVRRVANGPIGRRMRPATRSHDPLGWMPVMRHGPRWPTMRAFALPSFYDGRVRVNVRGREGGGLVGPEDYAAVLDEVQALLEACREPRTGAPVVARVARPSRDPFAVDPTDADLVVQWQPDVLGLRHPTLGTIGPVPPRRTGGHTSPVGRCLVHGPGILPGERGTRSSFDVLPTIFALAGAAAPWPLSGSPIDLAATSG